MSAVKGYSVKVPVADSVTGRVRVITLAMSGDIDLFDMNDCFSCFMCIIVRYAAVANASEDKCA